MKTTAQSAFPRADKRAFTLVELLTVIAIVAILAALLIPVVSGVRKTARNAVCLSNLRRAQQGIWLYAQDHKQRLPQAALPQTNTTPANNWVFQVSGFLSPSTSPDYLGIRVGTSLITVSSGRESVLLCKQNILDSGLTKSNSATTYAMNNGCYSLILSNAAHPPQTALLVESSLSGTSWSLGASASSGMSVSVHGNHSNVLYLDGHVGSVSAIPAATSPFWNP